MNIKELNKWLQEQYPYDCFRFATRYTDKLLTYQDPIPLPYQFICHVESSGKVENVRGWKRGDGKTPWSELPYVDGPDLPILDNNLAQR